MKNNKNIIRLQPTVNLKTLLKKKVSSEFQSMKATTFRDLKIWQEAAGFTSDVLREKEAFGNELIHSLISEACLHLVSKISEGFGKGSIKDFLDELFLSKGYLTKIQSLLFITENFPEAKEEVIEELILRSDVLESEINKYILNLEKKGENNFIAI